MQSLGLLYIYYYYIPTDSEERLGCGPKKLKKSDSAEIGAGPEVQTFRIPRATPIEKTRGSTLGWPASPWPASYALVPPSRLTSELQVGKPPRKLEAGFPAGEKERGGREGSHQPPRRQERQKQSGTGRET